MSKSLVNRAVGLFSLLVFLVLSMLNIKEGIEKHLLFIGLGFILAIASVFAISKIFPLGEGKYWLSVLPFALLAVVAKMVFSWDILLPFILCGYGAMAVSGFAFNPPENQDAAGSVTRVLPLATVLVAAAVYVGLCAVVGVFI